MLISSCFSEIPDATLSLTPAIQLNKQVWPYRKVKCIYVGRKYSQMNIFHVFFNWKNLEMEDLKKSQAPYI
jgi:hypothetical protein